MPDERFYKECRDGFLEQLSAIMRDESKNDPLIGKIKRKIYVHGGSSTFTNTSGYIQTAELGLSETTLELAKEAIELGDHELFTNKIKESFRNLRKEIAARLIKTVDAAAEMAGNVVRFDGDINSDAICELFEKVSISFEDGKARIPTLIVNPKSKEHVEEILSRPEVQLRLDIIFREKWLERYSI